MKPKAGSMLGNIQRLRWQACVTHIVSVCFECLKFGMINKQNTCAVHVYVLEALHVSGILVLTVM